MIFYRTCIQGYQLHFLSYMYPRISIIFLTSKLTQFRHGSPGPRGKQYESDQHHPCDDPAGTYMRSQGSRLVRFFSHEIAISDSDIENAYDGPVACVYIKKSALSPRMVLPHSDDGDGEFIMVECLLLTQSGP